MFWHGYGWYVLFVVGEVNVLVTITATEGSMRSSPRQFYPGGDVGHLLVKVIVADGLQTKSLGKRQPFVVLELVNQRFQTRTREGSRALKWEKDFHLYVFQNYPCMVRTYTFPS